MVEVEILGEEDNSKKTSVDSPPTDNNAAAEDTSIYIYNDGDDNKEVPKDVTHIKVDSSVTIIPQNAFKDLTNLTSIELPQGLTRIEDHAFENCKSLTSIDIPPTVQEIGNFAFCKCKKLQSISFSINEDDKGGQQQQQLERIGEYAFKSCKSITHIKLPTSITTIDKCAFYNCNIQHFHIPPLTTKFNISSLGNNNNLVSLEVHDNVTYIHDNVTLNNKTSEIKGMTSLISLRNVALPPSPPSTAASAEGEGEEGEVQECKLDPCRVGGKTLLTRCTSLIDFGFPEVEGDEAYITDALRQRFDNLPIHKICYHYCYNDTTQSTLTQLTKEIIPSLWKRREVNPSGKQQDCLGMTPLHILACSTKQQDSMEVYQLLIDKYPETLIMEDKWGDIPLMYAIWCNAPKDVIDLLVKSYNIHHPEYEFDYVITLRLEALNGVNVFGDDDDDIKLVETLDF